MSRFFFLTTKWTNWHFSELLLLSLIQMHTHTHGTKGCGNLAQNSSKVKKICERTLLHCVCCCKNCGKKWQQEKWKMITLYTITIPRLGCSILLLSGRGLVLKMPWFACWNLLSENVIGNLSGKSLFSNFSCMFLNPNIFFQFEF